MPGEKLDKLPLPDWAAFNIERVFVNEKLIKETSTHFITQNGVSVNSYHKRFYRILEVREDFDGGVSVRKVSNGLIQDSLDLQARVDLLDSYLSSTIEHPEWFVSVEETRDWIEKEIMQLECEELSAIENKNSRLAGRLQVETFENIIKPNVPQWNNANKGETIHV